MSVHIICGRPGNGGLNYLISKANEEAERSKTGFLLTDSALSHITENFQLNKKLTFRESWEDSREDINLWVKNNQLDVLYVELMNVVLTKENDYPITEEGYADVFAYFEELAEETGCTIYLFRQLSRQIDFRDNKRPLLTDLSPHEKKAASITGLYRDDMYNMNGPHTLEIINLINGEVRKEKYMDIIKNIRTFS